MAIRKYLRKKEDNENTKQNKIEIENIKYEQTTNLDKKQVERIVEVNMKNYLNYKIQILRNLKQATTIIEDRYDDTAGIKDMITQEVNLLIQLRDNR